MKFVKVNVEEVQQRAYKTTKWMGYLEEFIKSDLPEVEVVDDQAEYKDCGSLSNSIRVSINRYGYNLQVMTRNSRVYILKPASVLYSK